MIVDNASSGRRSPVPSGLDDRKVTGVQKRTTRSVTRDVTDTTRNNGVAHRCRFRMVARHRDAPAGHPIRAAQDCGRRCPLSPGVRRLGDDTSTGAEATSLTA